MIGFQPEVDLEEIGQHLRTGHELAVSWFSVVRGAGEEAGQFFPVQEVHYRGVAVVHHFPYTVHKQFFIGGIIGFRKRTSPG